MKCHHLLNYHVSDLLKNLDCIPRMGPKKQSNAIRFNPSLCLHDHVYENLLQFGNLTSIIFELNPLVDKKQIHIDLLIRNRQIIANWPTLNIVLSGQGTMRWYRPTVPGKIKMHPEMKNILYKEWLDNYGEIIDEWTTGKIALVRTDIPHSAYNFDNETRLLLSIRWGNYLSFEDAIEYFENDFLSVISSAE